MASDVQTHIVIPCYNEEKRLAVDKLLAFLDRTDDISILLVNDGSTDGTASLIDHLCRKRPDKLKSRHLPVNQGKGEAVRAGLLRCLEGCGGIVGYWDADFSAPLSEILHLRKVLMNRPSLDAVMGSRVKLVGRNIERRAWRHYAGRAIGTFISKALQVPVYDTQCGAKLFRASPQLKSLLAEPFKTRWLFDVEIIARALLLSAGDGNRGLVLYEEPLDIWSHMNGSKIRPNDFPLIVKELYRIWCEYGLQLRRKRLESSIEQHISKAAGRVPYPSRKSS